MLIKYGTQCIELFFNDFRIEWLGKTFHKYVPYELDFNNEFKNMNKIKNIYKDNDLVYVPTTIDNLCNGEVVLMEYCDGVFLDDIEGIKKYGFDTKEIITDLNSVF